MSALPAWLPVWAIPGMLAWWVGISYAEIKNGGK